MAFHANTVWEVRSTGTANGGGGFRSDAVGVDRSQQDSPAYAFTDMVIDGAVNTRFTSAARPGTTDDIGNVIAVTSGVNFTVQRVQITGITSGAYDVDKSLGTLGASGGNGNLGGACNNPATIFAIGAASNTYWLKGSFSITSGLTSVAAGTAASPVRIIGYSTTRAAALLAAPGSEYATITATAVIATAFQQANADVNVYNLHVDGNANATTCFNHSAVNGSTFNCKASNGLKTGFLSGLYLEDCVATGIAGGSTFASNNTGCFRACGEMRRCVATTSTTVGYQASGGIIRMQDCIARDLSLESSLGGHGVYLYNNGEAHIDRCTFRTLAGSGIYTDQASAGENTWAQSSVFASITRYGQEGATGATALTDRSRHSKRWRKNFYYSCTLGNQGGDVGVFPAGDDDVTLTADPFNSTTDLGLNAVSGGGASVRGLSFPNPFAGLSSTVGYPDGGAVQSLASTGGGTSQQAMRDLWREWTNEEDDDVVPDTVVDKYLYSGMQALNEIVGFSYTDDTTSVTLVAGTQEYDVPTDVAEIVWVEHNGIELEKADIERERQKGRQWRTEPDGTPRQWAFYGNKLVFLPAPDAQAVSADSTPTFRYIRTPRDFSTYGPEQLAVADHRTVVRWGVYEWSKAHPDSATATVRADGFLDMFNKMAQGALGRYLKRSLAKGGER